PAVPGMESTSVGVEYTEFAASCCGNPEWYRHWSFPGSWATGDQPLGHPLGGHGSELLLLTETHLLDARLRLHGRFFVRERGIENLYVPGREGRSRGGSLVGA